MKEFFCIVMMVKRRRNCNGKWSTEYDVTEYSSNFETAKNVAENRFEELKRDTVEYKGYTTFISVNVYKYVENEAGMMVCTDNVLHLV